MKARPSSLIGLLAIAAPVGCGNGASALDSESSALDGTAADDPGSLVVVLPPDLDAPPSQLELSVHMPEGGRAIEVAPGTPRDLAPGTYCLRVRSGSAGAGAAEGADDGAVDCSVRIEAGATTTYTLAAVRVAFDPATLKTAFDPSLAARVVVSQTGPETRASVPGPWTDLSQDPSATYAVVTAGQYVAEIAGPAPVADYRFSVPFTGTTMSLEQGQIATWQLSIPEWRFRLHLVPPARGLPSAKYLRHPSVDAPYAIKVAGAPRVEHAFGCPESDVVLDLPPASDTGEALRYVLDVYGIPIEIPAGGPDTQVDESFGRIEMQPQAGAYWMAVRRQGPPGPATGWPLGFLSGGASGPAPFPTSEGVDVVPGAYDITTVFDDGPRTHKQKSAVRCAPSCEALGE